MYNLVIYKENLFMGIIDNIFKPFKDTVFLKEDSNLEK